MGRQASLIVFTLSLPGHKEEAFEDFFGVFQILQDDWFEYSYGRYAYSVPIQCHTVFSMTRSLMSVGLFSPWAKASSVVGVNQSTSFHSGCTMMLSHIRHIVLSVLLSLLRVDILDRSGRGVHAQQSPDVAMLQPPRHPSK